MKCFHKTSTKLPEAYPEQV